MKYSSEGLENHSSSLIETLQYGTYKYPQKTRSGAPQKERGQNSLLRF